MFKSKFSQLGLSSSLLFIVGLSIFFTIISIAVWQLFTGGDMINIDSIMGLQFAQSLGMFIIPPLLFAYLWSNDLLTYLNLRKSITFRSGLLVVVLTIIIIPFVNFIGEMNQNLVLPDFLKEVEVWMKSSEKEAADITKRILSVNSLSALFLNLLFIALVPAIGEELFFRGALQRIFNSRFGIHFAIWVSAFVFSFIHFQFYGFLPRLLFGAFFGYLVYWSGSLWLPILAHFTNNAITIMFYYLKSCNVQLFDLESVGVGSDSWMALVSFVVIILFLIFGKKIFSIRTSH